MKISSAHLDLGMDLTELALLMAGKTKNLNDVVLLVISSSILLQMTTCNLDLPLPLISSLSELDRILIKRLAVIV